MIDPTKNTDHDKDHPHDPGRAKADLAAASAPGQLKPVTILRSGRTSCLIRR